MKERSGAPLDVPLVFPGMSPLQIKQYFDESDPLNAIPR